jgi:hypothetical protein
MADKDTHNPSQKSLQRWDNEGGAPKRRRAKRPRTEPKSQQAAAQQVCYSVYKEVQKFSRTNPLKINGCELGFRILYGPPVLYADYLFIGYQPGGSCDSRNERQHREWPCECEYAFDKKRSAEAGNRNFRLVMAMQEIWGVPVLARCTGLNAIFFRAPSKKAWRRNIHREARLKSEEFSKAHAARIVTVLKPQRLVVIGLETFDELTRGSVALSGRDDRQVLVRRGELWGVPTFGIRHLSGAWLSGDEKKRIKAYFENLVTA